MVTATGTAPIANVDTSTNLINMLSQLKGSSSTQTSSSNVSKLGMDQIIQQILAGANGISSIAGGSKSAGMYNSTTQGQLMNDFISRTAGDLAKQQAGTTQRTATPAKFGAKDILGAIAGIAGNKLLGPTFTTAGKKLGIDNLGQSISDTIFGTGASTGSSLTGSGSLASYGAQDAMYSAAGAGASEAAGIGSAGIGDLGVSDLGIGAAAAGSAGVEAAGVAAGVSDIGVGAAAAGGVAEGAGTIAAVAEGAGFWETAATAIAAFFCDERLKKDISPVGVTFEGQPIYTYKYNDGSEKTHLGVMAQETLKYHPEAVSQHQSGALMVDYAKLLGN